MYVYVYRKVGKFPRKKKTEEDFMLMFMFCDKMGWDGIGSKVSIYQVTFLQKI